MACSRRSLPRNILACLLGKRTDSAPVLIHRRVFLHRKIPEFPQITLSPFPVREIRAPPACTPVLPCPPAAMQSARTAPPAVPAAPSLSRQQTRAAAPSCAASPRPRRACRLHRRLSHPVAAAVASFGDEEPGARAFSCLLMFQILTCGAKTS